MRSIPFALAVCTSACVHSFAQAPPPAPRVEPNIAVSVDMFCSETKIRTTDARVRWTVPADALKTIGASLASARQTVDATVYKDGFDKNLFVSLPVSQTAPSRAVVPQAASAQVRPQLRAFQIRLIEVEQPRTPQAANATAQMGIVVENLEPGVNYTFRIAIDTPSGRIASPAETKQAPVCPADLETTRPAPQKRRK